MKQNLTRYPREVATELRASVNKREHQLHPGYLASLSKKDGDILHTVGPLARAFTSTGITNQTNFKGWVQASMVKCLTSWPSYLPCSLMRKLPDGGASMDETRPTSSIVAEQIRTELATNGIKLNARLLDENLQNMRKKSLPPTGARRRMELEYQDWARLQGR